MTRRMSVVGMAGFALVLTLAAFTFPAPQDSKDELDKLRADNQRLAVENTKLQEEKTMYAGMAATEQKRKAAYFTIVHMFFAPAPDASDLDTDLKNLQGWLGGYDLPPQAERKDHLADRADPNWSEHGLLITVAQERQNRKQRGGGARYHEIIKASVEKLDAAQR